MTIQYYEKKSEVVGGLGGQGGCMHFSQTSRYPILIKFGILKYRSGDNTILGKKTEIGGGLGGKGEAFIFHKL